MQHIFDGRLPTSRNFQIREDLIVTTFQLWCTESKNYSSLAPRKNNINSLSSFENF